MHRRRPRDRALARPGAAAVHARGRPGLHRRASARRRFAVTDAETGGVLGSIGVRWSETGDVGEIGYWLRADARGGGVTTRALVLISRVGARDGGSRAAPAARRRRERRVAPRRREGRLHARGRAAQRALERAPRPAAGLGDVLAPARRARVIPVIDGHNDALLRVWRSGDSLRERSDDGHLDLPRMREGGIAAGFFAIFVPAKTTTQPIRVGRRRDGRRLGGAVRRAAPSSDAVRRSPSELAAIAERDLTIVRTIADLELRSTGAASPGAILHFEGAEPIEPARQPRRLDRARRPVARDRLEPAERVRLRRAVPLSRHARHRPRPHGCGRTLVHGVQRARDARRPRASERARLLRRRRALGRSARRLACRRAHVCPMPRSLTDAQLDAIGDSGGLVGVVFDTVMTRSDGDLVFDTPLST